MQLKVANS